MKIGLATFLIAISTTYAWGADYESLRTNAIRKCEVIDPSEYRGGLYFNPAGYRSFYIRSECFQQAAVQFRDKSLCRKVIQRHSLFASSWGYSPDQCLKLVEEGSAADRTELEQKRRNHSLDPVQLRDFRIERNGNGRDYDILPTFTGSSGGSYILQFDILQTTPNAKLMRLHASAYYLDERSNLRIFIRQEDIRKDYPEFAAGHSYLVRATSTFNIGNGSPAGYWSHSFIESIFPEAQRRQSVTRQIRF